MSRPAEPTNAAFEQAGSDAAYSGFAAAETAAGIGSAPPLAVIASGAAKYGVIHSCDLRPPCRVRGGFLTADENVRPAQVGAGPSSIPARMMKRTLLPVLLITLLGGACADAVTSSPEISASGDALRSSGGDSESMLLASTYSGAQQPGWKTVATLPDSAWVVIDIIGQVYHSRNPDCDVLPPGWQPVNYPWDRLYAGPMFGASQVAVRPIPGGGAYRLWPVNGDPETATHARVLVYSRQPGMKVEVGRVSVMSLCGNPTAGQWSPMYTLAGGQQVTLTKIGSPLIFDAPDVIAPKQKATFAVEPHGSLRLLNPPGVNGKPGRLTWWYAPGDTLPEAVHAATGYMYVIPGCQDEKVCEHAPEKSGRLVVNGYVEGTSVFRKSHVIRVDSARLELRCNAVRVERAKNISCAAVAEGGHLTDIHWSFVDSAGNEVIGPVGEAKWGGTMVVGGRITVRARLHGDSVSRDTTIIVYPRTWSSPVPGRREFYMRCEEVTIVCFQLYPPTDERHFGVHVFNPRGPRIRERAAHVSEGPNRGWSYLSGDESPIRFDEHLIVLNEILNPENTDPVAQAWWAERPQCSRAVLHDAVQRHERRHADLYDERRHIVDAEAERTMAFVPADKWYRLLGNRGSVAVGLSRRIHEISGGLHRPEDGFVRMDC